MRPSFLLLLFHLLTLPPSARASDHNGEAEFQQQLGPNSNRTKSREVFSSFWCTNDVNDSQTCSTDSDDWRGIYTDHCQINTLSTGESSEHNNWIKVVVSKVASGFSLVGSVWTVISWAVIPAVRNAQIAIEVQLALATLVLNVKAFATGTADLYDNVTCCPNSACITEGAFDNFGGLASIIWSGCITTQAYLFLVMRLSARASKETYKFYYLVGGVPFVMTLWAVFAGYLGPAGGFCWIPSSRVWQQAVFYYMWLFLTDILIAFMLTHIGFAIRGTKMSGGVSRFIAYPAWAVFSTLGFIVQRSYEWAHMCGDEAAFALQVWNALFFPAQGLGYAVIFMTNSNVLHGWKDIFTCQARKNSILRTDDTPDFANIQMSEVASEKGEDGGADFDVDGKRRIAATSGTDVQRVTVAALDAAYSSDDGYSSDD